MTPGEVTLLTRQMMTVIITVASPVIMVGMVVGLLVGVVQAVTQIQEQSVSFVLKMVASGIVMLATLPWLLKTLIDYSSRILGNLDKFVR